MSEDKYPHYTHIDIVNLVVHMLKELIDHESQEPLVAAMIGTLGNIRLSQILLLQRLFRSNAGIVRSACLLTKERVPACA